MIRWMMAVVVCVLMLNVNVWADGDVSVVEVSATGVVSMEPSQAVIQMSVETFGKKAEEASRTNATKMKALIKALEKTGIAKHNINTISYRHNPEYEHKNGKRSAEPVGYRAHNMVGVLVTDIDKTGKVIDIAISAGGNQVTRVNFQRDEEQSELFYLQALEDAVKRAQKRASQMAHAAGQKLGKVLSIHTPDGGPGPMRESMKMNRAYLMADTPIEAGPIQVNARVTVRYALMKADD